MRTQLFVALLVLCFVGLALRSSTLLESVASRVRAAAASRASRRLAAKALLSAPPPWSPPALDAGLARCIRDTRAQWTGYLEGQLDSREGYLGGFFCNQCDREWIKTWSFLGKSDEALRPQLILDIGANHGDLAWAFLEAFPAARVHSFELDPHTFGIVSGRRARSGGEVQSRWAVTHSGVAREEGQQPFFSGGEEKSGLSSLGPLEATHQKLTPGGLMNVTTVPRILERYGYGYVDFVKIDVEGWEREVILGMHLEDEAMVARIGGMTFETGAPWVDSRKGPSDMSIKQVVDYLSEVRPHGYACFYVGRYDLLPISPPADPPQPHHDGYGLNVICFRRDTALHRAILVAHSKDVLHCLAGQGLWG